VEPSDDLGPGEREALRRALVAERDATVRRLASLERTFAELVEAADLEPPDDEHDPDGTTAYERAQVTSLAREARTQLARLDRALAGVDAGTVGTCARCGRPIGAERLLAVPGTDRCVACAALA
jgi:RNA polymerase-binding transcription factor DksA